MGLDVRAYRNVKLLNAFIDENDDIIDRTSNVKIGELDDYIHIFKPTSFQARAEEFQNDEIYSFESNQTIPSIPYSNYNRWRDDLAKLAGYTIGKVETPFGGEIDSYCAACWAGQNGPFSELIHFSDCEGVIGTKVCKKLAEDFRAFQAKADLSHDQFFVRKFSEFRLMFEFASVDGLVQFI